jgi:iron transport multicopper oxidase
VGKKSWDRPTALPQHVRLVGLQCHVRIPQLTIKRYHTEQAYLISDYLSPDNTNGDIPSPDAFLFNDTRSAPTFQFAAGKKYLLRMVSLSALACGQFHIDGHQLTVVGIDGVQTKPQKVDTILICAGQRYDVIVQGNLGAKGAYQYIAKMTTDMLTNNIPPADRITVIGKIVDSLLANLLNLLNNILTSNWKAQLVLDDMTLKPLANTPLYTGVTQKLNFKSNQTYYPGIGTRIGIGAQPWVAPKVPSAFTALSTGTNALNESTYGVGVDPHIIKYGDIVQIYMENPQPWPHPMHLHGHEFQTVARGLGSWSGNEASLPSVPMMRDVGKWTYISPTCSLSTNIN